jgi:hypothetical protein
MMGLWKVLKRYRWFVSGLRGINATAVGLIYAAVYRLWQIRFLSQDFRPGTSLGTDPWFLVIATTAYTERDVVQGGRAGGDLVGWSDGHDLV